jgi:transposase InsO family protein
MNYQQIAALEDEFPVAAQCSVLGVSRSGYYDWKNRPECGHSRRDSELVEKIRESYERSEQTYGSPRVFVDLKEDKVHCSEKRVARLMRENTLVSVHKKKYRATTNSNHNLPVAENVLNRDFVADEPNKKWVGDITYIHTREGWLYLAVVMDLFSRKIIGWSMSDSLRKDLATDALHMAQLRRGVSPMLFHSDQGVQYASGSFQGMLEKDNVIASMSRRGNCWDNAVAESFFHSLKVERVHRKSYASRAQARADVFDYIERFYNRQRRHSSLCQVSPANFEEARLAA